MLELAYITGGLLLLIAGGDYLVKGASGIAVKLKVTPMLIGMTVVAVGTSAPELVVSLKAALAGKADIAVGNVVGSNIANVALILGITALIYPSKVKVSSLRFDWVVLMLATLLFVFTATDLVYNWTEGMVFIFILLIYIVLSIVRSRKGANDDVLDIHLDKKSYHLMVLIFFAVAGSGALLVGADLFLTGAESIAKSFGISDRVIALSLVALGTSIPELAASVMAAFRKEMDISLGNIMGSNLFNMMLIIGATSLIQPVAVSDAILQNDYFWMASTSFAILPLALHRLRVSRVGGVVLLLAYVLYIYLLVTKG